MKRSLIASAIISSLAIPVVAVAAVDTPPTKPGTLSAKLYNGAGGELFWTRSVDDRSVKGYEITRNGENLGVRDALSFYDPLLRSGTAYTFTVTAIDSVGQRSPVATTTLGNASNPSTTPSTPIAGAPASPGGLRATIYSHSNGELFWNRASVTGLKYEVRRDGELVRTTDGVSYYASGLSASKGYSFEVVAVDNAGRRSSPARYTLSTDGNTKPPVEPSQPTTPAASGIAPTNITMKVYSSTAAELFWTPAQPTAGPILKNEVRRNGTLVATLPGYNARSYYDNKRISGTEYTYKITAISATSQSAASFIDGGVKPTTPTQSAPQAGVALPLDVATKLKVDFELMNGQALEKMVATIRRLKNPAALGFRSEEFVPFRGDPSTQAERFLCPKGGTLDVPPNNAVIKDQEELFASDCAVGQVVINGLFSISNTIGLDDVQGSAEYVQISDASLDDARDLSTIMMSYGSVTTEASAPETNFWFATDLSVERVVGADYSAASASGAASDTTAQLPDGSLGLTVAASTVKGGLGSESGISTNGPFEFDNGRATGFPTVGRLSIGRALDSKTVWNLDAFNGDPATFTFVIDAGGSVSSYTVPWSDDFRFRSIDPSRTTVGF